MPSFTEFLHFVANILSEIVAKKSAGLKWTIETLEKGVKFVQS